MMLSTSPNAIPMPPGLENMEKDTQRLVMSGLAIKARSKHVLAPLPLPRREDEESTEAPSCSCSDAEAGWESSADDDSQSAEATARLRARFEQDKVSRARQLPNARKLRSRAGRFAPTPLDPIPGTPVGMIEHPPLIPMTGPLLSTVPEAVGASSDPPSIPKRPPRNDVIDDARYLGMPLKVSMLQDFTGRPGRALDPSFPAKKKPILPEAQGGVVQPRLRPSEPVKKRVTSWLTAEPVRVVPAAPR